MPFSSESPDSPESKHNPKITSSTQADTTAASESSVTAQPTRRSLREAQARQLNNSAAEAESASATSTAVERVAPAVIASTLGAPAVSAAPPKPTVSVAKSPAVKPVAAKAVAKAPTGPAKRRISRPTRRGIISTVVMTAAAALIATMALPAYAFSTNGAFDPNTSTQSLTNGQQTLAVDASAANTTVGRDNYQAPTKDELAAQQQAAAAAAAAAAAQAAALKVTAVASAASTGASLAVEENAPIAPYDGNAVVAYAKQFVGKVPYGNGNSPDTSFSCDGLVQYVMKHFGVNLPRTVSNQAALGVRIPASEAQPGDVMIYPIGHTEIYAGNGMAVTAPDWGRMVEFDPVWGSYYFVRYYPNS